MPLYTQAGCTLLITNIPLDMDLSLLKADVNTYGTLEQWETPPGPVHVYARFQTKDMATRALMGLREHRRLVVDYACLT